MQDLAGIGGISGKLYVFYLPPGAPAAERTKKKES